MYLFKARPVICAVSNMKTQKSIHTKSIRPLLLMVPVICSMAFAACSDVDGTAGMHATVNLRSGAVGTHQTGDNVTIGPRTYNSETAASNGHGPLVRNTILNNRKAAQESGASLGNDLDKILTEAGVLARRLPFQSDPVLRRAINARRGHVYRSTLERNGGVASQPADRSG